jgi:hypothetical protein
MGIGEEEEEEEGDGGFMGIGEEEEEEEGDSELRWSRCILLLYCSQLNPLLRSDRAIVAGYIKSCSEWKGIVGGRGRNKSFVS